MSNFEEIEAIAPLLYEPVGVIQATENTPDIVFPDDRGSEKVAVLTFLTLWFMPKSVKDLIKQRTEAIICGLSPLSGGMRLENVITKAASYESLTRLTECFDFSTRAAKYSGACRFPKWGKNGKVLAKGHIAIYATSIEEDEIRGYTAVQSKRIRERFEDLTTPPEDGFYKLIGDRPPKDLSVASILEAYHSGEDIRDQKLAEIFAQEFSDIQTLFDMVPKRLAHEVAHMLEHGSGLYPHDFIAKEAMENIPRKKSMLNHYRQATEAVAELAGIALLQHVRENAKLQYGIPTTMLDKVMPNSYDFISQQVDLLASIGLRR